MFDEDELIPISALQHWAFCPRQAALIHVERVWMENRLTAEGRVLHRRVESGARDTQRGRRRARSVAVHSNRLGVHGVCDVVEFWGGGCKPIEYKRGRPKPFDADHVQVAAQGICLEEMLGRPVETAELYYGRTRRRELVRLDDRLRARVQSVIAELRSCILDAFTPPPVGDSRCDRCSLRDVCLPLANPSAATWFDRVLDEHLRS